MQANIHPKYDPVKVTCACGNEFMTRSTIGRDLIRVEVCNACHPFYTGKYRVVDTARRIDKFMMRYNLQPKKTEDAEAAGKDKQS